MTLYRRVIGYYRPYLGTIAFSLFLQGKSEALHSAQETALPGASSHAGHAGPDFDPIEALTTLCRDAEALGAGALWACDHLFWDGPTFECLTALTLAATTTERAALGTCVMQLPLRRPSVVAKQVGTLQTLSRGRVILGVGVGSHPGEFEQAGIDYHSRGKQLDAGITELRRAWSDAGAPGPGHEGRDPSSYRQLPVPVPVPVWVGGSSDAARRRAARLGDGWLPLFLDPSRYRHEVELLAKDVATCGREAEVVTPAIVLFVSVDDDPAAGLRRGTRWMSSMYAIPPKAFERHIVSGTTDDVAKCVADYRDAGAEHVALYVTDDRPLEQFERLMAALPADLVQART